MGLMLPPPLPAFKTGFHMVDSYGTMPIQAASRAQATPTILLSGLTPQTRLGTLGTPSGMMAPGYTNNHLVYHTTRQSIARNAYALQVGHVVVVEVRAVHMPVGKTKSVLIGVCKHDNCKPFY